MMKTLSKNCLLNLLDKHVKYRVSLADKIYQYKARMHRKNRVKLYRKLKAEKKAIALLSKKQRALSIYASRFKESCRVIDNEACMVRNKVRDVRAA